jgi:hypothetical protein
MKKYYFIAFILFSTNLLDAQHHSHNSSISGNDIKALTSEQVSGYLNGEGMGLAKVAELNHYPGPKHVLDLVKELGLNQLQIDSTKKIISSMKEEAVRLGKLIIEKEKQLDQLFSTGNADDELVKKLVNEMAEYEGELRLAHLNAHLKQKSLLTAEQISLYDKTRGYNSEK